MEAYIADLLATPYQCDVYAFAGSGVNAYSGTCLDGVFNIALDALHKATMTEYSKHKDQFNLIMIDQLW